MLRLILQGLLLTSFIVASVLSSHAQQPATGLTGEWVGNSEPPSGSQFLRVSLTENAGEMVSPLKAKLSTVQLEGSRVRLEVSAIKLVMTGTLAGDVIEGEAEVPGIKAPFRLLRTVKVAPEILARYVGAYRFRNGDHIVIDRFPNTQDTLWVTDVKSGQARTIFPRSEVQFTGGPALYVASPTRQTLTFRDYVLGSGPTTVRGSGPTVREGTAVRSPLPDGRGTAPNRRRGTAPNRISASHPSGVHVVDLDHKGRKSGVTATRVPIRHEEVTFKNRDVTLAGTLLLPAAKGKRPALVFVHGSGAQSREMYWGLGYLYAARGFAVLAYDKRGVGKSSGNWREASFQDLADDAVAAAKFLQARTDIAANQIGFWGQSQGGWIAPLAASRLPEAAFAVALSGGGLSPADTELFDTEFELIKAGYTADEVKEALAWQRLKNEIIGSADKWDEYTKARAIAKDKKWFRHRGIDVYGAEKPDDPFWTHMRRSYVYDPAPALRASPPLLAIFGELDSPDGVKAQVSAIKQILDQAGRRDYTVKVYPNGSHNLMEVPPDNPNEWVRLKRFPPGFFETVVDWTTTQVRKRPTRR
ncbi:MAG TPA: alpha/beta fold hydrolase [Pyrinomonadaceae bacterium]|nr:alpha/beta fold hydrolase [Pyrinomonadaceae bacterium]